MRIFLLLILIPSISCACPCAIPCDNEIHECQCFGPCGNDGYGCKVNGEEYEFFEQIQCGENSYQVKCLRKDKCSPDYAHIIQASSALSLRWFAGNLFNFFSRIGATHDPYANKNENIQKQVGHGNEDESESSSASKEIDPLVDQSLNTKKSAITSPHAFYRSISMPLYTLILCIILSGFLGMCMCAGFIYCGLNYCCPLSTNDEEEESSLFGNAARKILYEMRKKQNINNSNEENGKQKRHRENGDSYSEDSNDEDTESTDSESDDTYHSVLSNDTINQNLITYEQQKPIELEVDLSIIEPQLQICKSKQRSD